LIVVEGLRRLLATRENLLSKIGEPLMHGGIGQTIHDCGVKRTDYVLRRALWRPKASPYRKVEPRQSSIVYCRDIRRRGQAYLGSDRIRLDFAGTHMR